MMLLSIHSGRVAQCCYPYIQGVRHDIVFQKFRGLHNGGGGGGRAGARGGGDDVAMHTIGVAWGLA